MAVFDYATPTAYPCLALLHTVVRRSRKNHAKEAVAPNTWFRKPAVNHGLRERSFLQHNEFGRKCLVCTAIGYGTTSVNLFAMTNLATSTPAVERMTLTETVFRNVSRNDSVTLNEEEPAVMRQRTFSM